MVTQPVFFFVQLVRCVVVVEKGGRVGEGSREGRTERERERR